MIIVVSLLVYTLAQRRLRQALAPAYRTIPNQKGKPNATPTPRWVFQSFLFIRWLEIDGLQTRKRRSHFHQCFLNCQTNQLKLRNINREVFLFK